jgi:hypothetical protein
MRDAPLRTCGRVPWSVQFLNSDGHRLGAHFYSNKSHPARRRLAATGASAPLLTLEFGRELAGVARAASMLG